MNYFAGILGKLNSGVFPHDKMTLGAAISIPIGGLFIFAYLTYTKRWKWLWKEWLTVS